MISILKKYFNKLIGYGGLLLLYKIAKCNSITNKKKILRIIGLLISLAFFGKLRGKAIVPLSSTLFGINNPRV